MLITHLLITDPDTPQDVLTALGTSFDLDIDDAITLASRIDLPAHTTMRAAGPELTRGVERRIAAALADPTLPPSRRRQVLAVVPDDLLNDLIANYDSLTPDELTHVHDTRDLTPDLRVAFGLARRTPTPIAAETVAWLRSPAATSLEPAFAEALADAASVRHALAPTTDDTRAAAGAPDPHLAYAKLLADRATTTGTWEHILEVNHHPHLLTHALAYAAKTAETRTASAIHRAVEHNPRNDIAFRIKAANTQGRPTVDDMWDQLPSADLSPIRDTSAWSAIAWGNPNVTAPNLLALYRDALCADSQLRTYLLTAIALHPASPLSLRRLAAAHLPADVPTGAVAHHVVATSAAPTAALDVPYLSLFDYSPTHPRPWSSGPNVNHLRRWARTAWAHANRPTTTPELAAAYLAVAGGGGNRDTFTGTLRELIDTATTIAT